MTHPIIYMKPHDTDPDMGWWKAAHDGSASMEGAVAYVPADASLVTDDQLHRWIIAMGDWDAGGEAAIEEMEAMLDARAALAGDKP